MQIMDFEEKLLKAARKNESLVSIGLDIDREKMPPFLFDERDPIFEFNKKIIDETRDIVCAYKPNMAFYLAFGIEGIEALKKTIRYIPSDIPVILDAKMNDIGNTARKYASAVFEFFGADAVTISPYLGKDSIMEFTKYEDKCSFILCRTSNPSAGDFQDLSFNGEPLYQIVAKKAREWNCGVVAGATYPKEIGIIREIIGDLPMLIPGIGVQEGDIEGAVRNGTNDEGEMAIINSSRGIIYASRGKDFAKKAREACLFLREKINKINE